MSKPLANFDYLITKKTDNPPAREVQQTPMPQNFPNVDAGGALAEALAAAVAGLATPILRQLDAAPGGKQTMFQLVETHKIKVDDLRPVLDLMESRHGWISTDKSDLKGDWAVTLTSRGRDYLQRYPR